jgi:hypothetical protein
MGGHESTYFLYYAALCVVLGLTYIKVSSTEGTTITTNEFQYFQKGFLSANSAIFLGELLSLASFYPIFLSLNNDISAITKLYIVYIISNTLCSFILDIIDFGTRKDKCILSCVLYTLSLFST